jgi:hypothetical protein
MSELENKEDFLNYLSNPLSRTSIDLIYNSEFIMFERCDLYCDFVLSLVTLVFDTYMGDDVTNQQGKLNHFKWCWDKTVDSFMSEGIKFGHNQELYEYFLNFMVEVYYSVKEKKTNPSIEPNIIKLWKYIFNYQISKTRSDVDTFVEVYNMFEKSLKNGKKLDF